MPELFVYLLKVNIALVLFYLVFHFWLRRLTFYTLNRFYLLFAFLFSAFFPLFNLKDWMGTEQPVVPGGVQYIILDWESIQQSKVDVWPYLELLFWSIVVFFVLRMLFRLISLWQIHRQSVPATWHFFSYRHVLRRIDPFSFWKNIYVHVEAHQEGELYDIFSHEQIHVEQLHTLDTLLAELFTVVCWFNPVTWLMRKGVRENLEFITDRRVILSGVDRQAYQYSLLKIGGVAAGTVDTLGNHFNFKHLKTRIMMMNKRRSSNAHLGKYIFAIPAVVLLALVFTLSKAYEKPVLGQMETWVNTIGDTDLSKEDTLIVSKVVVKGEPILKLSSTSPDSTVNIRIEGDSVIRLKGKKIQLSSSTGKPMVIVDGIAQNTLRLRDIKSDDVESVVVVGAAGAKALYGAKAAEGVVIVTTKQGKIVEGHPMREAVAFREALVLGDPIRKTDTLRLRGVAKGTRVVEGKLFADSVRLGQAVGVSGRSAVYYYTLDSTAIAHREGTVTTGNIKNLMTLDDRAPYILIDGEEGDISTVSPDRIKSIRVFKGDNETLKKYGPKALYGVILVEMKK